MMRNFQRKIKFLIVDEAYLRTLSRFSISRPGIFIAVILFFVFIIFMGAVIIMITPLHNILPGYMKEEQRYATEENILRLDSLNAVYHNNQAYIDNFLRVTDTERRISDSVSHAPVLVDIHPDSLMTPTKREQKFVKSMAEREKFNISVLAPLAADGMIFYPVSDTGLFTAESQKAEEGEIIIPRDGNIMAIADGRVISAIYSPKTGGYRLIIQHLKGFVSEYTGAGNPMVMSGDPVIAGQIIAAAPFPDARNKRLLKLKMWHNTHPVIPFNYVGDPISDNESDYQNDNLFEAPRGRL